MTQMFRIEGRLHSRNEYDSAYSASPHKGAKLKQQDMDAVEWAIRANSMRKVEGPFDLICFWHEPRQGNGALRDPDNIASAVKVILDALQSTRIIGNDNPHWVKRIVHCFEYNNASPHVTVALVDYEESATVTLPPVRGLKEESDGSD